MKEVRREAERIRDVMLLLQHLSEREETTIKTILDCLYDVGSVNWIDQKFRNPPLNRLFKSIAWMPKPVFRIYAMRWFKKNGPQLITNWLHSKVSFEPLAPPPSDVIPAIAEAQPNALAATDVAIAESDRQIRQLRSQVRVLAGLLVGVVVLLGGALVLPSHSFRPGAIAPQEKSGQ